MNRLRIALWLLAGTTGSVAFWLVQLLSGGPTIPDFIGAQIIATGGYPKRLTTLVGWAVHLGVSVSYASLFAVIVLLLRAMTFRARAALAFLAALALGYLTALIAPPAISVTIGLLSGQGWPAELYPLNTEFGLPFWNHVVFFLLNWTIQAVGPRLRLSSRSEIPAVVAVSLLLSGCVRETGPERMLFRWCDVSFQRGAARL